jgi:hypothetical protein
MSKPTANTKWAASATKTEPSSGEKDAGWTVGAKPPAQWFNWWMDAVDQWVKWLDAFESTAHTWTALQTLNKGIAVTNTSGATPVAATAVGAANAVSGVSADHASSYGVYGTGADGGSGNDGRKAIGFVGGNGDTSHDGGTGLTGSGGAGGSNGTGGDGANISGGSGGSAGDGGRAMVLTGGAGGSGGGNGGKALQVTGGAHDGGGYAQAIHTAHGDVQISDGDLVVDDDANIAGDANITGDINLTGHIKTLDAVTLLTPTSPWTNLGGGYTDIGCWTDKEGIVHLQGDVSGTSPTSGTEVCVLPVGKRPPAARSFAGKGDISNNKASIVSIFTNGQVVIHFATGHAGPWSLNGITFRTDA